MKYDVIVIGAGLGGLECATLLTKRGFSVLVLEQGAAVGGAMQDYNRGGLIFDTGLHYVGGLGRGQSLRLWFEQLGLMTLPWHRLDREGFDHVMIGGRDYRFANGYEAFVDTLAQDFPEERAALCQYVKMLQSTDIPADISAYDYLCCTFHDPLLINVLSGASMRMELRRESLPLHVFAHCQAPYLESSWRLKGSGRLITDTLVQQIKAGGGEVLCRSEVEELRVSGGRVVEAVCKNGTRFQGRWFISSLHPAATCRMVSPKMRTVYPRRIEQLENTCGMLTVSLQIAPRAIRYFNYNQYIYKKANVWTFPYDVGGIGGVMVSARVPEDGSSWVRQIDLLTPLPWEKCRRWAGTRMGHRGEAYLEAKNRLADECVALAAQFLPKLPGSVVRRYVSTPLTWRDYTLTPCGSAFGVRKDCRSPLLTNLSPRTPIPNLLLTGQSIGLHGVQGVTMSAFDTCSRIED